MKAAGFDFPDNLLYLVDEQVWARLEADGTATVGITSLGVHLAGEVYMCRPKSTGTEVQQGGGIAVVELAKSIVSVKSPLGGRIVEVNPLLAAEPERVHREPYGRGWLARLQPAAFEAERTKLVQGEAVVPAMEHHARLFRADET